MTRLDATRVVAGAAGDAAVVASLGHPAYDLYATGDRDTFFYTWGSMGVASSIGLGLAMAQPTRRVIVLDGDGSLLMNLGSLATIATVAPPNLIVIVWDNGEYGTTGGQPAATANGADLAGAAAALGVPRTATVVSVETLESALQEALRDGGPAVIVAKVKESSPAVKPSLDYEHLKRRFMAAMTAERPAPRETR